MIHPQRLRPGEAIGPTVALGEYALAVPTGACTVVAAGTASAGHLFAFRNAHATSKIYLRYVAAQFVLTTAFGSAQEVGLDLRITRSYSASHSGGTAIDMGGTNTNANKRRVLAPTSAMASGDARVATTDSLTNGTHTIDVNSIGSISGWAGAVGVIIAHRPGGSSVPGGVLYDARDDQSPIVLGNNEGFLLRNTILMGASGVGRWQFWIEWDEGTL